MIHVRLEVGYDCFSDCFSFFFKWKSIWSLQFYENINFKFFKNQIQIIFIIWSKKWMLLSLYWLSQLCEYWIPLWEIGFSTDETPLLKTTWLKYMVEIMKILHNHCMITLSSMKVREEWNANQDVIFFSFWLFS